MLHNYLCNACKFTTHPTQTVYKQIETAPGGISSICPLVWCYDLMTILLLYIILKGAVQRQLQFSMPENV